MDEPAKQDEYVSREESSVGSSGAQTRSADREAQTEAQHNEHVKKIWPSIDGDISNTHKFVISRTAGYNYVSGWGGVGRLDIASLGDILRYLRSKNKCIYWWLSYSNNSEAIKNITNLARNGDGLVIGQIENFTNWLEDLLETLKDIRFNEIMIDMELVSEDLQAISQVTRATIYYKINGVSKIFEPDF